MKGFWHSFGTVGVKLDAFGTGGLGEVSCFQRGDGATRRG